jgi:hypothetical protein
MRMCGCLAVSVSVLFLAACGGGDPNTAGGDPSTAPGESSSAKSEPAPSRLYEVNATVLEDRSHGPMLCLSGILESLPPQCGNVPIANWDWQAVRGEERLGKTTWGDYHLVGSYDGTTFTLTEVGRYEDDPPASATDPDLSSPCPEPAGGWSGLEHATQEDARGAAAYARSQPDYVALWVTHLEPARAEFGPVIVNAVFTGDRERHEAEMRGVWDGPLCVVERDVPTADELAHIRKEAEGSLDQLGLQMLWSDGPGVEPVIEIGVVVDVGGKGQAALDARYGTGIVRLIPALKPAS